LKKTGITIGHVLHPSWCYDLEATLRAHRLLVQRALAPRWRFKGTYVTTGPLETLLGHSGCGSRFGCTDCFGLKLFPRDGLEVMVQTVQRRILVALCEYPDFATLAEPVSSQTFLSSRSSLDRLSNYECGRTRRPLNSYHKRATLVKNVRLECRDDGVRLAADVSQSAKPHASRWELFWAARIAPPKWHKRRRLATWIQDAEEAMAVLVRDPKTPPPIAKQRRSHAVVRRH